MSSNTGFNLTQVKTANDFREKNGIVTYGALILPFDVTRSVVVTNPKTRTSLKNKITSAFKKAGQGIKNAVKNPTQTFKDLSKYMSDNRKMLSEGYTTVASKFSGIAVAQSLMNGKVSSKEAADYLFMGFAPALGVQGSLMGYSGLSQMKDSLKNGTMDVGGFVNGFSRTLKGLTDLKDKVTNKEKKTSANIIQFDLTVSHSENYQAETPDRRVQSGQSLNEFVHNMPETIEIQCALQEGKRYSKAEFRAILQYLRSRKDVVSLVLGDEMFNNLILTSFSPTHDCTKSGMDYSLSFKKVNLCDVDLKTEVTVQTAPELVDTQNVNSGSSGGNGQGSSNSSADMPKIDGNVAESSIKTNISIPSGIQNSSLLYIGAHSTADLFGMVGVK